MHPLLLFGLVAVVIGVFAEAMKDAKGTKTVKFLPKPKPGETKPIKEEKPAGASDTEE